MTLPEQVMWATVLLVGLPAAFRNITAAALCLSWGAAQAVWLGTGDNLPLHVYVMADMAVIAAIVCKCPARPCFHYSGIMYQLCAFWTERSFWDRIVLGIFPVMWLLYFAEVDPRTQWYALFYLALAQFLAAGGEVICDILEDRSAKAEDESDDAPDLPSSGVMFGCAGEQRGYG